MPGGAAAPLDHPALDGKAGLPREIEQRLHLAQLVYAQQVGVDPLGAHRVALFGEADHVAVRMAEEQRAARLMTTLASIASSAPFVGLLGTVYGIMDAFQRIGAQKSASLPVVAPGIGAALVTTLMGLVAAIPALVFYNLLSRKAEDFLAELESASEAWVSIVSESDARLSVDRAMVDPRLPRPADPRYPDRRYPSQERR